jgi:hypothetical protein
MNAFSTWLEIDLSAIREQCAADARHTGRPVMAVIKANGYGHGLVIGRLRGAGGWSCLAGGRPAGTKPWRCARPVFDLPVLVLGLHRP